MAQITWLGHAGFVVEAKNGSRLAIDVWKDAPTFPANADLDNLDLVVVTHGHFDHAGSAPDLVKATGATLVCIHEITFWAQQNGVPEEQIVGMNKGGTFEKDGWKLTMVQAIHSGGCPGGDDHGHHIIPGGSAAGWVIETPDGERIYHAGDTTVFLDMQLIRELYHPALALLPIGGHYTMGPREAAKAIELLGVDHVIPMHYGTFPILAGTPDELREHAAQHVAVHVMEPGTSLDVDEIIVG